MSILVWTPKNFADRVSLVKSLSIQHKTFDDDLLRVNTTYKGVRFELSFRNCYKHKKLECVIYKDGFHITMKHDKKGYITGHDFIQFVNRICNNIDGV